MIKPDYILQQEARHLINFANSQDNSQIPGIESIELLNNFLQNYLWNLTPLSTKCYKS